MRREDGFTLVELLVGLALTAVAATLLLEVIGASRGAAARVERKAIAAESVATAQALLRAQIERLAPDAANSHGSTEGDAAHLTFVAPPLGNAAQEGPMRYHVGLGTDGVLDLAAISATETATSSARWRVLPLIDDVRAIDWSYFGAPPAGGPPAWQTSWQGRDDPPRLVRLRLRFGPGNPRRWPELIVQPAATVSTACDLDPTTGTCRAP